MLFYFFPFRRKTLVGGHSFKKSLHTTQQFGFMFVGFS
jgi:hypothetical protein